MRIKFQRCLLQTACKSCKICLAPIIILYILYICCNLPIFVVQFQMWCLGKNCVRYIGIIPGPLIGYLGKMAGSFYRGFWRVVHHLGGSSCSLKICCLRFIVMDILDGRNGIFYWRFGVWRELRHLGGRSCSLNYAPTSTDYCPTPITLSINGLTHADHQPAFLGHDRTQ